MAVFRRRSGLRRGHADDRCQLVQYFPSLAVRGFREPVIQVGTAPVRGQQLAKPAGLPVTHHGSFVVTPRADRVATPAAGLRIHRDNA
jgi:hypothetical protein